MREAVEVSQPATPLSSPSLPLYWRVCLTNGFVFAVGSAALVVSPASVSSRPVISEIVVLALGLVVILLVNAVLLRTSLAPLDKLVRRMDSVDLQATSHRLPEGGSGQVARLVGSFNAMLTRLESERDTANARALAAQEAERQRIARELHDEVGQGLTVVLLGLKRVADRVPAALADELRLVQESARSSLDEVREVAGRLRPGVLEDLGLLSALTALTTDFSARSGVHVRRGFAPGLPELTSAAELVLYRIAQEALTNVARHAGADTVELTLARQGDALVLRVADDGRGTRHSTPGAGIRGMRERALLVSGEVHVTDRVGGGTEVRLLVPVVES